MTTKLGLETTVGAAVSNDNTVTGASGSSGVVAQYIEDVGSSPPTGTLLVTDLSRSASSATAGFAVNEVLTLPDSTGAQQLQVCQCQNWMLSLEQCYT